jgi:NADH-quinone oxidoreductase subunit N
VVALLAYHHLARQDPLPDEFYVLLAIATLGAAVVVAASHFVALFLGLELLSVSLYALIAYARSWRPLGLEAAAKYLVLAGGAAGFLLFGMALMYAATGSLELRLPAEGALEPDAARLATAGVALLLVGLSFKLGLVPLHFWTPDVYQGAPTPVVAFLATVSKGAVLGVLVRLLGDGAAVPSLKTGLTVFAVASMIGGNLLALLQPSLKRILGCSSIAHMGYAAVALIAGGPGGAAAVGFYLVSYFATMLGLLGIVAAVENRPTDAGAVDDFRGLASRRPWLACGMSVLLLSLAGMPLTSGFVAKFALAAAGADASLWMLLGALAVGSVIGIFYYLRVTSVLYAGPGEVGEEAASSPLTTQPISLLAGAVLSVLTVTVLVLGVYPGPLLKWVEAIIR